MNLLEVLNHIPPSQLEYQEWVNVGMALKHEGFSCSDWDSWSSMDSRHKAGECEKKWKSFNESAGAVVTGGTIYEYASRFGFSPKSNETQIFAWDDEISYDGDTIVKDSAWLDTSAVVETPKDDEFDGVDQLRKYLQALFKPSDIVGFCVDAEEDKEKNKWRPSSRGVFTMTAGQLLEACKKAKGDICNIIGDYHKEAGAWIRFNPLDGTGVSNGNVTDLRFALVESDTMEIEKQKALIEELKLPVVMMVHSGGKSVHAIIRIDAVNTQDYREKVDFLYKVCEKNGLHIDTQNKNPSRMSRLPGVYRNGKKQFIIAEKSGFATFDEWKEYIEDSIDTLPEIINFAELETLPELSPELIHSVLRKGHKMLISGASKAGKSFLLIELALCITSGRKWLEFDCSKGKVLYINLEVDGASFLHRIKDVMDAMGMEDVPKDLDVWNLRGENACIDQLAPRLIRRARGKDYAAVIFDPLYKINQNDENSASEMGRFFNQLDYICAQLQTSIICCHHHSKGAQGGKFSIDRASGSGVFARDPDALLDMIQINPSDVDKDLEEGQTAWRISCTLREFMSPDDIDVIFKYPVHEVTYELKDAEPMTGASSSVNSARGVAARKKNVEAKYQRLVSFVKNWEQIDTKETPSPFPTLQEAKDYFHQKGFSIDSMKRWIEDHDDLEVSRGFIIQKRANE